MPWFSFAYAFTEIPSQTDFVYANHQGMAWYLPSRRGIIYLSWLINMALPLKYVSQASKVAKMIVLLKPGKPPENPGTYKPISLLSITAKIFEKVVLQRMQTEKDLFHLSSFAFEKSIQLLSKSIELLTLRGEHPKTRSLHRQFSWM